MSDWSPAIQAWFAARGWQPTDLQRAALAAWRRNPNGGLLHAPTGSGKTLAAVLGWLCDQAVKPDLGGLRVLWVTPLRALAADTERQLREIVQALSPSPEVARLTGDTPASQKQRLRRSLPPVLVTTPETLSLLLSHAQTQRQLAGLDAVIIDEWHELLGSKRGVLLQLALARIRTLAPASRRWGLSATLANLDEACAVLMGPRRPGERVSVGSSRRVDLRTLLPETVERFPWSGHLGLRLLPQVIRVLELGGSTLLFTNTRAQAELWYDALVRARLDWLTEIALHHGSLEAKQRRQVEQALAEGRLRCVVCTASLDLGVDFQPVDRVIQVGSPKSLARLLQRAGRSGHRPGADSEVWCVPTHALELQEFAAAREALAAGLVERREPRRLCLDVLVQHVVTLALAVNLTPDSLWQEVRDTDAFASLSPEQWDWVLQFVCEGGSALGHYPEFRRVVVDAEGRLSVPDRRTARQHRMMIGTITSDAQVQVTFRNGRAIGTVEESFVARLQPGDAFLLGGRTLEFIRLRNMQVQVRAVIRPQRLVPRWSGSQLPWSASLAEALVDRLTSLARPGVEALTSPGEEEGGAALHAEERWLLPLYALQARWSALPRRGQLLVEQLRTREGFHCFFYPFAGRQVHEGLAALLAWRLTRQQPRTIHYQVNDYGIELFSPQPFRLASEDHDLWRDEGNFADDVLAAVNSAELARRHFRELARIAGLIFQGVPGAPKSTRLLQMSSGVVYQVLRDFDPSNQLLEQAIGEVLEEQLAFGQLRDQLRTLRSMEWILRYPERLTPLAFPLWAERSRAQSVSSESWEARLQRVLAELEQAVEAAA